MYPIIERCQTGETGPMIKVSYNSNMFNVIKIQLNSIQ